ncbi:hypothetical protein SASPL_138418 [Salvia splendens]|uniref:RING finger and CHY zinc finger domain-containing protein 1 n=1 Tax=Salvia splendens TaxID=180675 RepID=A0A8X8WUN8_SALSN|nr:hypothetical protein SASPL_138418 [Salvia splendens]
MDGDLKNHEKSHSHVDGDECRTAMGFGNYGHCHNEAKNLIDVDTLERHDIPRHEVTRVICSLCNTEQDAQQICISCGVCLGKYYCSKCKFFDDDVSQRVLLKLTCIYIFSFHFFPLLRRTGGEENFFHCDRCECCYSNLLKESHLCIEKAMHHNCPICFEYIFDTTKDITVLPCGHTIHLDCVKEMETRFQYTCPVCLKSYCDMTRVWEKLDEEVALTPMPQIYQNKMVWILCNDCGETSEVNYHIVAHKCLNCRSYNTSQTRGGHASCSSGVSEML